MNDRRFGSAFGRTEWFGEPKPNRTKSLHNSMVEIQLLKKAVSLFISKKLGYSSVTVRSFWFGSAVGSVVH